MVARNEAIQRKACWRIDRRRREISKFTNFQILFKEKQTLPHVILCNLLIFIVFIQNNENRMEKFVNEYFCATLFLKKIRLNDHIEVLNLDKSGVCLVICIL